jgi:hypothetical protein
MKSRRRKASGAKRMKMKIGARRRVYARRYLNTSQASSQLLRGPVKGSRNWERLDSVIRSLAPDEMGGICRQNESCGLCIITEII